MWKRTISKTWLHQTLRLVRIKKASSLDSIFSNQLRNIQDDPNQIFFPTVQEMIKSEGEKNLQRLQE
jgi:hypothetical protein